MRKTIRFILLTSLLITPHISLKAVPADPQPRTIIQPDGSSLTVKNVGNEYFHYQSTLDGYPVVETENGYYQYATYNNNGNWVNTGVNASDSTQRGSTEKAFLQTLSSTPTILLRKSVALRTKRMSAPNSVTTSSFPTLGSPRSLVILVNFQDKSFSTPNAQTAFSSMLNLNGYSANNATGSAKDYFSSCSMAQFTPQFDVYGPYTLPQNMKFYGANSGGYDINPEQMVIDACSLANNDVNFADYDLNGDGILDEVFIYYAGYNEAEGASQNTIWPHRWYLDDYNTIFDNVSVYDYACTSELKDYSGTNMCGIGTFCHEFGHVLGLADLYKIENPYSYTCGEWDVMDEGNYNNSGNTPPTYSAYERFYLGWLTPEILSNNNAYSLDALGASNKAYLISPSNDHNLNGQIPDPAEFFLIENRQQTEWDKYLPGHGLLATHIIFNADDWENNTPNNSLSVGVDIIEADGQASFITQDSDAFPYATTNYLQPQLSNGDFTNIRIEDIQETDGKISFNVKTNTSSTNDIQNDIRISTHGNTTTVTVPEDETDLYIYNIMGQLIQTRHSENGVFELNNLPHQQVILLKSGKYSGIIFTN